MKRRLALAALLAGLALVPAAAPAPSADACCVDAGLTAAYDARTKKVTVKFTVPAPDLILVNILTGRTLAGSGILTERNSVGKATTFAAPYSEDFYVQVQFACDGIAKQRPSCGGFERDFAFVFVHSVAVKVTVAKAATGQSATLVVKGTATVVRADGTKGPLKTGATLGPGDRIMTGAGSVARLAFSDGSQVAVGPNATLELGEGPAAQRTFLQNLGEIWYSLKKLASGRYYVQCRCAITAAVRGTTFTYAVKGKTARLRVYDGSVAVTSAKKTVLVKKGFETTATGGKAPSTPKAFTPPANPFWES